MIYSLTGGYYSYVYDANSGDILYINPAGGLMNIGTIKEDDVKDLAKEISKS
ncbi:hypothetical protein D3C80_2089700 [compost metagenome]